MGVVGQIPAKERVRGQKLAALVRSSPGVPMEEAIRRADEAGRVVASNKMFSNTVGGWIDEDVLSCWFGTMACYVEPGLTFRERSEQISSYGNGHFVVYQDAATAKRYLFPVPEEHLGRKDALLVAEHPDYGLVKEGNDILVLPASAGAIGVVEGFPPKDGFFPCEQEHGIPSTLAPQGGTSFLLWRQDVRVGLVARSSNGWETADGLVVVLNCEPSELRGVAVEAP